MVEYGNGIGEGPAGQVGGSGGTPPIGTHSDVFAPIGRFVNDAGHWLSTLSPIELVVLIVVVFFGLMILRRAF